ncbi:grasp-with-spasm system SPASM domain peptide maturase [Chitinophaga nivalis]|uniref:Grasp-with-spasm system SPASM domain peptide maturase n=1 Tax=Chitinophaga nivalis TaxID=2991709 RepID=A0ABT3IJM9_9BACT|nr:grasp-with-spasm system SPASM domain peptide maturase [Chitinophaga nivalis]MCW3466147.1 grasp-with-spasm system SPASM domain peptide maturase [Chitinophaga nivalis]MCW3484162.1 grasp-with-spasm system SPASM domain peptide maturase [Chitinophaga nivalis]
MAIRISQVKEKYLYLYANCYPVKGYTRTMICDLQLKKLYFVDNTYFTILTELRTHTIGEVADMLEDEADYAEYEKFIRYLLNKELAAIVDDLDVFPPISMEWDHPAIITNSIIDIRDEFPDFQKIFTQLDELGCHAIQIRAFTHLSPRHITAILALTSGKNFRSVQLLFGYKKEKTGFTSLSKIAIKYPIAALVVYDTPDEAYRKNNAAATKPPNLTYLKQDITSCESCGIINLESLQVPSLQGFIENITLNSCLNRKISIDEQGEIKNCPSMKKSYGNIKNTTLKSVIDHTNISALWPINKDAIEVCKDCEYRYICTDCRAYTTHSDNLYAKPAKCKYDPYTAKWSN